jgi:hypothetical protein
VKNKGRRGKIKVQSKVKSSIFARKEAYRANLGHFAKFSFPGAIYSIQ